MNGSLRGVINRASLNRGVDIMVQKVAFICTNCCRSTYDTVLYCRPVVHDQHYRSVFCAKCEGCRISNKFTRWLSRSGIINS